MKSRLIRTVALIAVVLLASWTASDAASLTFYGCFTYFPAGPCKDVFQDGSGNLWICADCGTTKNPSTRTCSRLTGSGYWCS